MNRPLGSYINQTKGLEHDWNSPGIFERKMKQGLPQCYGVATIGWDSMYQTGKSFLGSRFLQDCFMEVKIFHPWANQQQFFVMGALHFYQMF